MFFSRKIGRKWTQTENILFATEMCDIFEQFQLLRTPQLLYRKWSKYLEPNCKGIVKEFPEFRGQFEIYRFPVYELQNRS